MRFLIPLHFLFFDYVLHCLTINGMLFGFLSWMHHLNDLPRNRRLGLTGRSKREMVIMFCVVEQRSLQRPVKIAFSVYCVFDPVGNTLGRRSEVKPNGFLPGEKYMSHSVIAEHCLSRLLVLFYPLIKMLGWKRLVRAVDVRGKMTHGEGIAGVLSRQ